jgi:hypothetical protein
LRWKRSLEAPVGRVVAVFATVSNEEPAQGVPVDLAAFALAEADLKESLGNLNGGWFSNRFAVRQEGDDGPDELDLLLVIEGLQI